MLAKCQLRQVPTGDPVTEQDWEEASEVTHVGRPDTIPSPPPTEPQHERPNQDQGFHTCLACGSAQIWDASIRSYVCDNPDCPECE